MDEILTDKVSLPAEIWINFVIKRQDFVWGKSIHYVLMSPL